MNKDDLRKKAGAALATAQEAGANSAARSERATTSPGALALLQPTINALNERAQQAEAKLTVLQQQIDRVPMALPLDGLIEVDGRRRKLSPAQFDELKANLARNPLIHPVAVRKLADGRHEIVSGANRVAAYRELGRPTIPVVVLDIDESQTDRSAFYANLLQPDLPDFEKYLGFKHERDRSNKSQKSLASEAGISEAFVSMLFSFETLPDAALEAIAARPESLGINCANDLAKAVRAGKRERVVEAVKLLVQGSISQKDAVAFALKVPANPGKPTATVVPVKIKAGRKDYCQVVGKATSLRVTFDDEPARVRAQELIEKLLREVADQETKHS
jgi:ParB family transcriptional regulator, chromosome partitioning protein